MRRTGRCWCLAVSLIVALAAAMPPAACAKDDPFSLEGRALATLSYGGQELPPTSQELLERFPTAQLEPLDQAKRGMQCYLVPEFAGADTARFYYCDDRLYQFEASYSLARLEKLGGAPALLRKLIDTWGPVDHAGESRWTWKRPMYSRRADFYAWPDRAKLTITDLGLLRVVTARRNEPREPAKPAGF